MFTAQFWKDVAERAISTFAQTFIAFVTIVGVTDWVSIDWVNILVTSAIAAGLSVLKSLISSEIGVVGTASVVPYEYDGKVPAPVDSVEDEAE